MKRVLVAALLALSLTACTNSWGVNTIKLNYTDDGKPIVEGSFGKEADKVYIKTVKNGDDFDVTYYAEGVKAFEGQRLDAETQQKLIDKLPEGGDVLTLIPLL